jgi:hypothetical protein
LTNPFGLKAVSHMLNWDRSHDWVLQRYWNDLTRVTIQFRQGPPSVAELAALRRCLPQYRHTPPAKVRAMVPASGVLNLGVMPTRQARELIGVAQAEGLEVVAESASFVSYLPYDRTTGCAWLIEDDVEALAVARAMQAAGISVVDIQA